MPLPLQPTQEDGDKRMPFDALPRRLTDIPEFRPQVVNQLPKPSIWPGIAEGAGKLSGVLAKALDPVEKAKEKLSLAQLSFQTKALADFRSGKLSADDFDPATGLPLTTMQKLTRDHMKMMIEHQRKSDDYNDKVRNSTWDVYGSKLPPRQQRNDTLPDGGPVMPDEIPGASAPEALPNEVERYR